MPKYGTIALDTDKQRTIGFGQAHPFDRYAAIEIKDASGQLVALVKLTTDAQGERCPVLLVATGHGIRVEQRHIVVSTTTTTAIQ